MRRHPLVVGLAKALAIVAFLATMAAWAAQPLGYPAPEFCYALAGVGVAIFLGYVVETVWMASRAQRDDRYQDWLGGICGFGLSGLLGIAATLAVGAHRDSGHGNLLDDLGIWWSIVSLGLLGILVALHPFIVSLWDQAED